MAAITDLETHAETHVTSAQLAAYWNVGERTVQHWATKGWLPATRVGRLLRIRIEDARKFGRTHVVGPVASA